MVNSTMKDACSFNMCGKPMRLLFSLSSLSRSTFCAFFLMVRLGAAAAVAGAGTTAVIIIIVFGSLFLSIVSRKLSEYHHARETAIDIRERNQ